MKTQFGYQNIELNGDVQKEQRFLGGTFFLDVEHGFGGTFFLDVEHGYVF